MRITINQPNSSGHTAIVLETDGLVRNGDGTYVAPDAETQALLDEATAIIQASFKKGNGVFLRSQSAAVMQPVRDMAALDFTQLPAAFQDVTDLEMVTIPRYQGG